MSNVFDNFKLTGDPAEMGSAFGKAFEAGQKKRADEETRSALSAYAVNPDDQNAFQTLARYKPDLAIKIGADNRKRQEDRAKATQLQDLQRRAAQGDHGAIAEMAGLDLDAWKKLSDADRANVKQRVDYIGQAALAIKQLPPEERPAAWDHYVEQGVQAGYSDLGQLRGHYNEQALDGAIANAGLINDLHRLTEPKYMAPPPGSALVNVRDPRALAQYNSMVSNGAMGGADASAIPDGWEVEGDGSGDATGGFPGQP